MRPRSGPRSMPASRRISKPRSTYTIGSQVEALTGRVREDGLDVEDLLRFIDEGQSGAVLVRPALERLRDQAAASLIDRLYVHSPDRLARKYAYQILLVEEFQRCGIEVVFLNHEIGDKPEEQLRAPGKLGKGGSDVAETLRRDPVGNQPRPVKLGQRPEASLAWCRGNPGCEA